MAGIISMVGIISVAVQASHAQPRSLFSASFQAFCLTARGAYLNTQKYGLFCSPGSNNSYAKLGGGGV